MPPANRITAKATPIKPQINSKVNTVCLSGCRWRLSEKSPLAVASR
jgi:hypothetical protein